MPARCNLFSPDPVPTGSGGAGAAYPDDDGSPRSFRRGNYNGFLSDTAAADLQALQDSGVGLGVGGSSCSCGGACGCGAPGRVHPLILLAAGVAIITFLSSRRNQ